MLWKDLNYYTKAEDEMMWEIHEIRYQLREELLTKSSEQINNEALDFWENWKKTYKDL